MLCVCQHLESDTQLKETFISAKKAPNKNKKDVKW